MPEELEDPRTGAEDYSAEEELELPSAIEYPKPFASVEEALGYGWLREELEVLPDGRAMPLPPPLPAPAERDRVEREALRLVNAARGRYRARGDCQAPPLDSAPRTEEELQEALDCLGVRLPYGEAVFDAGVAELAEACAEAWGTRVDHGDWASLESEEGGLSTLVRAASVRLPPPLLELVRLHRLGSRDL